MSDTRTSTEAEKAEEIARKIAHSILRELDIDRTTLGVLLMEDLVDGIATAITAARAKAGEEAVQIIGEEIDRQDQIAPQGDSDWVNGACASLQIVAAAVRSHFTDPAALIKARGEG